MRYIEEVINEALHVLGLTEDLPGHLAHGLGIGIDHRQELGEAHDRGQRTAQLMRYRRDKLGLEYVQVMERARLSRLLLEPRLFDCHGGLVSDHPQDAEVVRCVCLGLLCGHDDHSDRPIASGQRNGQGRLDMLRRRGRWELLDYSPCLRTGHEHRLPHPGESGGLWRFWLICRCCERAPAQTTKGEAERLTPLIPQEDAEAARIEDPSGLLVDHAPEMR